MPYLTTVEGHIIVIVDHTAMLSDKPVTPEQEKRIDDAMKTMRKFLMEGKRE